MLRIIVAGILALALAACKSPEPRLEPNPSAGGALAALQTQAPAFNSRLSVPEFETTPGAVRRSLSNTLARANAALDRVGALQPTQVNFTNTVWALDDIAYEAGFTLNRFDLIKETSPDAALREAATEAVKVFQEWAVGLDYREDVYRAVKAFADTQPRLEGEDAKLLAETLRDYRRAGLHLPPEQRQRVEQWRKQLAGLATDFDANVTRARKAVRFTRAELEGVPEDFLGQPGVKTGADECTVMASVTFQYQTVMETAKREATRKRLLLERDTLAVPENLPLIQQLLELRHRIARQLGYDSWADYQIGPKMAKNAATARAFLEQVKTGLQPKFEAELRALQALKARDTGDPNARIHIWDWRYYANVLKKEQHAFDSEALRVYFPYDRVLQGMFDICQQLFRIRIERVEAPWKWTEDLQLFAVSDPATGEPLGLFYLDMFPREGKYNHFAHFSIREGKRLRDGRYQRPTCALICNFPTPAPDKPSLLTYADVETLFHEFGHALHSLLTRASYARFSGTSVPRDFVEAPSQMLENWVRDKQVLDRFAADYRDPSKKIPQETLDRLKAARLATEGTRYRRQLGFALMDLALHTQVREGVDAVKLANQVAGDVFLPLAEGTAFLAYFGHLTGYDAAYYGYAWADAIAADLATVFEQSPRGYADAEAGLRLRNEIYAPGDSRDVNLSIEKFLGRARSIEPFLKSIGIGAN
jgi:thimet oligopeptidase